MLSLKFYYRKIPVITVFIILAIYAVVCIAFPSKLIGLAGSESNEFNYVYHQWFNAEITATWFCLPLFIISLSYMMPSFVKQGVIVRKAKVYGLLKLAMQKIFIITAVYVAYLNLLYILGVVFYKQLSNLSLLNLFFVVVIQLAVYLIVALIYLLIITITTRNFIAGLLTYALIALSQALDMVTVKDAKLLPLQYWLESYYASPASIFQILAALFLILALVFFICLVYMSKDWIDEAGNKKISKK